MKYVLYVSDTEVFLTEREQSEEISEFAKEKNRESLASIECRQFIFGKLSKDIYYVSPKHVKYFKVYENKVRTDEVVR